MNICMLKLLLLCVTWEHKTELFHLDYTSARTLKTLLLPICSIFKLFSETSWQRKFIVSLKQTKTEFFCPTRLWCKDCPKLLFVYVLSQYSLLLLLLLLYKGPFIYKYEYICLWSQKLYFMSIFHSLTEPRSKQAFLKENKICWKMSHPQAIQDIDEFVSSWEQFWRNVASHHLLTNGCSAVNGCRQNESPNSC